MNKDSVNTVSANELLFARPRPWHRRRQVTRTAVVRNVGFGLEDEARLKCLQDVLIGNSPDDVASVSLIVRRAIKVYAEHVTSTVGNHSALEKEKLLLSLGSRMPSRRSRKGYCLKQDKSI